MALTVDELWLMLDYAVTRKDIIRSRELLSKIASYDASCIKTITEGRKSHVTK